MDTSIETKTGRGETHEKKFLQGRPINHTGENICKSHSSSVNFHVDTLNSWFVGPSYMHLRDGFAQFHPGEVADQTSHLT